VSIPVRKPVPIDSPSQRAVPGFIADHVIALRKGGPDAVETLQWRSRDQTRAKDSTKQRLAHFQKLPTQQ
jgi:hypothetical protein